jgi:peptidoglycan/LPS O-acetylase OafA/YrhL
MYKHLPSPVKFREDINGLRAWAVIAVLLFHFPLISLPGGFAGVDVFFVISGYLMTAIVVSKVEKDSFSILDFYMARIRRILPALLVVLLVLLILGWFWLSTPDYKELGKQSAYALTFLSNIGYWQSSGYFDNGAHEKWLLHTWSLAVEAQFYVLYPLIILFIWRFWKGVKALTAALFIIFAISFITNLWLIESKPTLTFYFLPTRGWELAAGGIVYLLARQTSLNKNVNTLFFWSGWLLLFYSFLLINQSLAWPGYWALMPVLGTSLIIYANNQKCKLTNNFLAQWLGDRSYSLYLWHWPLVVFLFFASLQSSWIWVITFFATSVILAHGSFKFIETPTRKFLSSKSFYHEIQVIGIVSIAIGVFAITVNKASFSSRLPEVVEVAANEQNNIDPRRLECVDTASSSGSVGCVYGNNKHIGAYLIGDSHASAVVTSLAEASNQYNLNTQFFGMYRCANILGIKRTDKTSCYEFNNWFFNQKLPQLENGTPVIVVNRLSDYVNSERLRRKGIITFESDSSSENALDYAHQLENAYIKSICKLTENHPVYLVRPIPEMGVNVPKQLSRNIIFHGTTGDIKLKKDDHGRVQNASWKLQDKAISQCGARILNPLDYLCDDNFCYGSKKGRPLYYDDHHLSEFGNKLLIPMFTNIFKEQS